MMDKHSETDQTVSPSGQLSFCYQMVYCGNQDYLIVKRSDTNAVIHADILCDQFTFYHEIDIYWEANDDGEDVLVYDILYKFLDRGSDLQLIDAEEIHYYDENENNIYKPYYTLFANKEEIKQEHRIIKYKRDSTKIDNQNYEPYGHRTDFNCEMTILSDTTGELFNQWRKQDKCHIYKKRDNIGYDDKEWETAETDWKEVK